MADWNSNQYIKFKAERTQPAIDLINRIALNPKTVLDIGCGPGNSTFQLSEKFPLADILGVDNSENMLQKATNTYPKLLFQHCNIPAQLDDLHKFDLIFSNACLHWIPNHYELFPKLAEKLTDGGILAVQMPLVQYAQFYRVMNRLLKNPKWSKLQDIRLFHNVLPEETYSILTNCFSEIIMWETTYYHVVSCHNDVLEWYKGSGLRPYLEALKETEKEEFLSELKRNLETQISVQTDKKILLKMPRLFFVATKQ